MCLTQPPLQAADSNKLLCYIADTALPTNLFVDMHFASAQQHSQDSDMEGQFGVWCENQPQFEFPTQCKKQNKPNKFYR